MKTIRRTLSCVVLASLLFAAGALAAEPASQPASADWPQWRGPNRDGIAPNSPKLLGAWPKEGPKLLWKSGPIPGSSNGGVSSPVVADGRVFVYADHPKGYVVTSKMLADWGWIDGVPDELAEKIEKARTTRAGADLEKYINDFLATLDADQAKKFGEHIRKRIKMGGDHVDSTTGAAGWWGMASIVNAGVQDKVFPTLKEWTDSSFGKDNSFKGHRMIYSHGDGGVGANFIMDRAARGERSDMVFCLDASAGKQIWKAEFPGESVGAKQYALYWITGASSTPAISNGNCYVVGSGGVYCLSAKDGSVVWKTKAGFTHSSPLVANGMVYCIFQPDNNSGDARNGELKAFDAKTGKLIWTGAQGRLDAWGSVASWNHGDKNYLIVFGSDLMCIDAANGELVWEEKSVRGKISTYDGHLTPVVIGDLVVIQTGAAYKITPQKAEVLWKTKFVDYVCSPIVYQDHIITDGYYAPRHCVDVKTGQRVWEQSRAGEGHSFTPSPAMADEKVFIISGEGMMNIIMVKATGDKCEVLGRFTPPSLKACDTSPAIAYGRLYVRSVDCVACYDLTEAGNKPSATTSPEKP